MTTSQDYRLAVAELLEDGLIVDSGQRRNGQVVWISVEDATPKQIEESDRKHKINRKKQ